MMWKRYTTDLSIDFSFIWICQSRSALPSNGDSPQKISVRLLENSTIFCSSRKVFSLMKGLIRMNRAAPEDSLRTHCSVPQIQMSCKQKRTDNYTFRHIKGEGDPEALGEEQIWLDISLTETLQPSETKQNNLFLFLSLGFCSSDLLLCLKYRLNKKFYRAEFILSGVVEPLDFGFWQNKNIFCKNEPSVVWNVLISGQSRQNGINRDLDQSNVLLFFSWSLLISDAAAQSHLTWPNISARWTPDCVSVKHSWLYKKLMFIT